MIFRVVVTVVTVILADVCRAPEGGLHLLIFAKGLLMPLLGLIPRVHAQLLAKVS